MAAKKKMPAKKAVPAKKNGGISQHKKLAQGGSKAVSAAQKKSRK